MKGRWGSCPLRVCGKVSLMVTASQVSSYFSSHRVGLHKVKVIDLQCGDVVAWIYDAGDPKFMYDLYCEPVEHGLELKTATIVSITLDVKVEYVEYPRRVYVCTVEHGILTTRRNLTYWALNS